MADTTRLAAVVLTASLAVVPNVHSADAHRPPNVVLIFTDDQGYQDLGCYGSPKIRTPNIDRLAARGMRFTDFYDAAPVCTPSRAALMTGCYAQRVSLPAVIGPDSEIGINGDEITIAELLKDRGYATACIGKWHLGDHPTFLPPHHGFDLYFGLPYSNDMSPVPEHGSYVPAAMKARFPPLPLFRGLEVIETEPDQSQLTRRYTEEAIEFITANQDRPFFLYLPHTMPHTPLFASERFKGRSPRGLYGDVVEEIDWSVGRIIQTLHQLGLEDSTLVIFTSDNGPWLAQGEDGGSALPLRGGKATTFEGGMRVPGVMYWPGTIPAGAFSREMVTTMDLLPTLAGLAGASAPTDRIIDGRDIWPILSGHPNARSPHEELFYYYKNELRAVRSGRWKLIVAHEYVTWPLPDKHRVPLSLYDLSTDIGETVNLAEERPDVVERLQALLERARDDLGDSLTNRQGRNVRPPGRVPAER